MKESYTTILARRRVETLLVLFVVINVLKQASTNTCPHPLEMCVKIDYFKPFSEPIEDANKLDIWWGG